MRRALTTLVTAAAFALGVSLASPVLAAKHDPDWERLPISQREYRRIYPAEALRKRIAGKAVIQCQVRTDRVPENCQVLSETPPDMGFGDAALKLSAYYRFKPKMADGVPVDGGVVTIPIALTPW